MKHVDGQVDTHEFSIMQSHIHALCG